METLSQNNHKVCPDCDQLKPYSEYYRSSKLKRGIQVYCKECSNRKNRAKREERKTLGPSIIRDKKECQKCHNIKPINQFGIKRDASDGHVSYCKPCWVVITKRAQAKQLKK